jgi:sporulation protein YlmC with PRC-barrel domain
MTMFDFDDVPNWRGRDVMDENGHAVGIIADLYVDDATGRPEWAAVKTGLFSHRVTFVPLAQARLHGQRVQVPYRQGHIHEAPNIEPHGRLTADEEARLYQHYGLDYGPVASGAGSEFVIPAADAGDETARVRASEGDRLRLRRHEGG